ncbi:hypothetical protein [Streptomyces sp. NPDC003247]|uniref:right-handed parallel beta-helix repeat-containing protein n=1 Tax=Streptomyces sp. NPDC003247 TaxID=3364677 RepID=UPI003677D03B
MKPPVLTSARACLAELAMVPATVLPAALVLPATASASTAAPAAIQATYYVAPDGDDANPGTLTQPFRTLQHARDVVRTVNSDMTGDIHVCLRAETTP